MIRLVATAFNDLPVAAGKIREILEDEGELSVIPLPFHSLEDKEKPLWFDKIETADAFLIRSGIVDRWLINQMKNCKVISLHGVGVDQVDVDYCKSKGIIVTNVPGGNANAAAELTIGMMLDSLRGISKANLEMKNEEWEKGKKIGNELGSSKVGILGMGNIGSKVASLCEAFGAEVAFYDKYSNNTKYKSMEFNDLLKWCEILTIHVPLNDSTRSLISLKELELLGPNGIIVNVARGPIINQKDLTYALNNKLIKWAACDVFDSEPPNFNDVLFSLQNTTLTPHLGGSTYECLDTIATITTEDILKVCKGEKPNNPVY
ncbi:MAG: NAD(P)-dependent oxidoreductase [Clostridia bacterium]